MRIFIVEFAQLKLAFCHTRAIVFIIFARRDKSPNSQIVIYARFQQKPRRIYRFAEVVVIFMNEDSSSAMLLLSSVLSFFPLALQLRLLVNVCPELCDEQKQTMSKSAFHIITYNFITMLCVIIIYKRLGLF